MQITFDVKDPISVLSYIVPGFVFIMVYKFFSGQRINKFEGVSVGSIAISVLLNVIIGLLNLPLNENILLVVTVVIAALLSGIVCWIRNSKIYLWVLKTIWHTTGRTSIWQEIIDLKRGTKVRLHQLWNETEYIITGTVVYCDFDPNDTSKNAHLALKDYAITPFPNGKTYDVGELKYENTPLLYVDVSTVYGLELFYDKTHKQRKSEKG